jgi:hypothetical protein
MGDRRSILYILIGIIVLCAAPVSLAAEGKLWRTQGLINSGGGLKGGYLFINEMRVYVDRTTKVTDQREIPIPVTELKPKRWVYMEVEKDPGQNFLKARKIYLLHHYVKPKERNKLSFMR